MPSKKFTPFIIIVMVVFFLALITGILTPILFASGTLNTIIGQENVLENEFTIDSDYVAKGGVLRNTNEINNIKGDSATRQIAFFNFFIDNFYGYAIFNSPIELNQETKNDLINMIDEINEDNIKEEEFYKYFSDKIFSNKLRQTILKDSYDYSDLKIIMNELDDSASRFCKGVIEYSKDNPSKTEEDLKLILDLCVNKPQSIFKKLGLFSYELNLPDVKVYDRQTEYSVTCSEIGEDYKIIVGGKSKQSIINSGSAIIMSGCNGNAESTYPSVYPYLGCYTCSSIKIGDEKQVLKGIIRLSNLKLKVTEKTGDIFIGVGQQGVSEMDAIDGKFDFQQYGLDVKHEGSKELSTWRGEQGFIVISNSQNIIDASEGKVDRDSNVANLWKGIKSGDIFGSPSYLTMILVTGVSWVFVLISGIILSMFLFRKK